MARKKRGNGPANNPHDLTQSPPQFGIQDSVGAEFSDVRRPGYNYMDPHGSTVHGEPQKFPEIPNDPGNTVYGKPSPEPTFDTKSERGGKKRR